MSTSLLYHAFAIRGYKYTRTAYDNGKVIFSIYQEPETYRCSVCGSARVISRGQVERRFLSLPIGGRGTMVVFAIPRVECQACDQVRQVEISFAEARRSYTKSFERYALELSRSMTIRDVARHLNVGWDLIKDFQKRDLSRRYAKPKLKHLRYIAIDEIAVAKGHRLPDGGHGPGKRGSCLRRRWQGGRRLEAVLETAPAQQGQAHGCGHGHVGGVLGRGHDPRAQGEDRLRPLPCHQALQRQALRSPPCVVPRGDRRHAEGGTQGDAVAVAKESGEPRQGEGREASDWRKRWR